MFDTGALADASLTVMAPMLFKHGKVEIQTQHFCCFFHGVPIIQKSRYESLQAQAL